MPTWKKVVISGSGVSQLSNDANYLVDAQSGAILSGSFTGSFVGDGSGLTGVVAAGTLSGSSQVTIQDTTGFSDLQSNISASFAVSSSAHTQREALTSTLSGSAHSQRVALDSAQTTALSNVSGAFATTQATQDGRIDSLESFTASLDDTYATEAELNAATASVKTYADSAVSTLSGSAHTQRLAIESGLATDISDLSGSAHTGRVALSSSAATANINLSSDLTTAYTSADTALSSSAHVQRTALSASLKGYTDQKVAALVDGAPEVLDTLNELAAAMGDDAAMSASFATTLSTKASISQLNSSGSTLQSNIDGLSGSAHTQREALSGSLKTYTDSKTSDLSGSAHTDRIAKVNVLSGSAHTDRVAKIAVLSGSAHTQRLAIESSLSTDITNVSSSFATTQTTQDGRISSLESFTASLDDTFATEAELNAATASVKTYADSAVNTLSGSAHTQRTALSASLKGYTDQKVAALVDGAPEVLDTLNELAAAMGDDAAMSASFATTLSTKASISQLNSSGSTLQSNIDGLSGSAHTQRLAIESGLTSDLSSLSGSAHTQRLAVESGLTSDISSLSGSAHTDRVAKVSALSGSAHTQRLAIESGLSSDIGSLSGSAHVQREAISSSFATTISGLSQTLSVSGSTGEFDLDLLTQDLTINGEKGISTSASGGAITITTEGSGIVSSSVEGDVQGQIKINGVNVDINALGAGDSPTFQDLTVNGNLTTLGTVTNINTVDLNVEDKFILLNSGSASGNSGLVVQNSANQGQGTAFFWDDTSNRWALDFEGADSTDDTALADAYVAAVVTTDDANYQKVGNIRVDTVSGEAFIYTAE